MSNLYQCLKSKAVPFNGLYSLLFGKPPISVHDESNMSGDRSLSQSADEEVPDLEDGPFNGRRLQDPIPRL